MTTSHKIFKQSLRALLAVPLLTLAACGGEYVPQPYHGVPYGERTAGSGVEYVLAKMAPKKGVVTEAAKPEEKAAAPAPKMEEKAAPPPQMKLEPEMKEADPVFNKMMKK